MELNRKRFSPDTILAKIHTVQKIAINSSSQVAPCSETCLETLLRGQIDLQGLMPWSSNYTFLVRLAEEDDNACHMGIYKPGDGERPLWDFPDRTLSQREFASYLVSQVLGWPNIPATVLRDGPHGLGTVQLFVEADYEAHYFNLRDKLTYVDDFRRMALFDYIINNADRKGGHCLQGKDGTLWAIDHGLTFHTDSKLRTVIWEFGDQKISKADLKTLVELQKLLNNSELCLVLTDLINPREIEAFKKRVNALIASGRFPTARYGRSVPYPPI